MVFCRCSLSGNKTVYPNQAVEEDAGIEQIVQELGISRLENAEIIKEMTSRLESMLNRNGEILRDMLNITDNKLERLDWLQTMLQDMFKPLEKTLMLSM